MEACSSHELRSLDDLVVSATDEVQLELELLEVKELDSVQGVACADSLLVSDVGPTGDVQGEDEKVRLVVHMFGPKLREVVDTVVLSKEDEYEVQGEGCVNVPRVVDHVVVGTKVVRWT